MTHETRLEIARTGSPAYGWVKEFKARNEKLSAKTACVSDEIKQAVNNGHYRYVSMSLHPGGALRRIGLPGAAPAIPGLAPVEFAGEPEVIIDFSPSVFGAEP